ncbi:hypothetical protein BSKO_02099 [Bryopsis sp. KO-2023]|nr:hypothetical protein BSKO_02099 [Bryopsis sp. KO-2023]
MADSTGAPLGTGDLESVYQCLRGALQPASQKPAEAALEELASRPGFCSCLVEIIKSSDADESSRWLASVHLKNTVNKSWRTRRDDSGLSKSEKEYLQPKLIELLGERDKKVIAQVNVIFSKIARFDFPTHWPSLFSDVFGTLGPKKTPEAAYRVYLVLQHVLKELSTKRLPADQKLFAEVTSQLYEPFWQQWCADSQQIVESLKDGLDRVESDAQLAATLQRWLVLLKAVRRMLAFGFPSDARTLEVSPTVSQALPVMLNLLQSFLPHTPKNSAIEFQKLLGQGMTKLVKCLSGLQEIHPWAYCQSGSLIPCLQTLTQEFVGGSCAGNDLCEGVVLHGGLLIRNVLDCKSYRGYGSPLSMTDNCKTQEDQLKNLAEAVKPAVAGFFKGGQAQALAQAIIEKGFKLSAADLLEWSTMPEAFYHQFDTAAQTTENMRGVMEALFVSLLKGYRELLGPTVMSALETVSSRCPVGVVPTDQAEIGGIPGTVLEKEAVYHAVAVGSYDLYDYVNFSSWYRSTLVQELNNKNPKLWPLRRQAAILAGAWVSELKDEDRTVAYRGLAGLLSEADLCLKLTAVSVLRLLIDDWAFQEKNFVEFAGPVLESLAQVLQSAEDLETQIKVFGLVNVIVERMGDEVKPLAGGLVQLLPRVWNQGEGQSLLRMQVLTAYQHLLNAIGAECPATFPWLVPAIAYSIDVDQPESLVLLEDGLNLWLVALRNTTETQGGVLLDLFPHVARIMERSTGELWVCMQILSSCVLLGGIPFISKFAAKIASQFSALIGDIRDAAYRVISPTMENILRVAPAEGAMLLKGPLVKLTKVLLMPSGDAGVAMGANTIVFSAVTVVFSRVIMWNAMFLVEALQEAANSGEFGGTDGLKVFFSFLDLWLEQFDAIASETARKLSAAALSNLLPLPFPGILERLDVIFANLTTVCGELEDGLDNEKKLDGFSSYGYDFSSTIGGNSTSMDGAIVLSENAQPEADRKRVLHENDPINTAKISTCLKQKLEEAARVHGDNLTKAFNQLDPAIKNTIERIVKSQKPG